MKRLRHPIRAIHEPFGKAGLIVAVFALVFAMLGGAYAATGGNGGKQIATASKKKAKKSNAGLSGKQKKEVKKISQAEAKKFAGKPGANGAPGTPGATGPAGKNGENGHDGSPGANGKSVVVGTFTGEEEEAGEVGNEEEPCELDGGNAIEVEGSGQVHYACNGKQGEEGEPWTVGNKLPANATETGAYSATGAAGSLLLAPISFTLKLSASLDSSHVVYVPVAKNGANPDPTDCQGTAAEPKAARGFLCVYSGREEFIESLFTGILPAGAPGASAGADVTGAVVQTLATNSGANIVGTWAVTG